MKFLSAAAMVGLLSCAPDESPRDSPPRAALLFVVDKSGSFSGRALEIMKEGCIGASKHLDSRHLVGVLAFDLRPHWVVRFSEAGPEWNGAEAVMGLTADGGTDIGNALEEALVGFQTDARVRAAERKHLILISDGDTVPRDWESVLMHLSAEGVTLSTICLGSPRSDEHLMYQLTEAANGRFRSMTNSGDLARALMSETRRICAGP